MSNLINDGSLIGYWPLHENSGTPTWKNYSPARAYHPSGVTFDLHVHVADEASTIDGDSAGSPWPGQEVIFNVHSGVFVRGLKLQGQHERINSNASAPYSKMIVLGNGSRFQRVETLAPAVANSGFTAGFWVYPNSNGWIDAVSEGGFNTSFDSWFTGYARTHNLMGQFRSDVGWYMGVSGELAGATQFNSNKFGGPHELRGFLLCDVSSGPPLELDTPIESGTFTHLTMSYRYVDGTSNEIVLYKHGRVAASGITSQDIIFDSNNVTGPDSSVFNLGGSNDGSYGTDSFEYTSGWGHLVSGVYLFRRVLDEGEILSLHECGGLQPDFSLRDDTTPVLITDNSLVTYIENKAPGWIDSSKNHYNFISQKDPGDRNAGYSWDPGPFKTNRSFADGSNVSDFIVAPSGAIFDVINGEGGFTICGHFQPNCTANDRDGNMLFSIGSVSTAITGPATPASVSSNTLGMALSYFDQAGFGDRLSLELFPIGDGTDGALVLRTEGEQIFHSVSQHIGVVYDEATQGVALYLDGYETASGTLSHNIKPHLLNLAGSGFPLMFMNGIRDDIADSSTKNVHTNGGAISTFGPLAMFSRPLLADELRFIAQSGIDTSILWRTRQDPRLMGYWPCDSFDLGDVVVEDRARAMSPLLCHLSRGDTNTKWERVYNLNNSQDDEQVFRNDGTAFIDLFTGETRVSVPALASFGNLGITSGIFGHHGGSSLGGGIGANLDARNTPFNVHSRWRPSEEQRQLQPQNLNEYILSFEVTPSGNIPAVDANDHGLAANQRWFNSYLHVHGNMGLGTADGDVVSLLTTVNAGQGSGVTIAFVGRDGSTSTNITPIISGTLPFGVPTRVLFHSKFDFPYFVNEFTTGSTPVTVSLWIDGNKVNQTTIASNDLRLWSDQVVDGSNADWILQFGGYSATDSLTDMVNTDGGLGDIYMREIFLMRGVFEFEEVAALANSGIQNTTIAGYNNQLPTTQVTLGDSNLLGYWRFNGFEGNVGQMVQSPGGSGTTDLSLKNNHLDAIAQRIFENGTSVDLAESMRALAGPHLNSDLGIQCSGFHNASIAPANTDPNMAPPFAVSGVDFDSPADGFSIGFLMAKRDDVATNSFDCMLCYGTLTNSSPNGTVIDTTVDPNRGWAIGMDDNRQLKMIMSIGGNMYLNEDANVANSGQIVCGLTDTGTNLSDLRSFKKYQQGDFRVPNFDYYNHYCWTYDPSLSGGSGLRCYLNGVLVDERFVPNDKINPWTGTTVAPQVPVTPECRMLTFRSHMAAGASTPGGAWDFGNNLMVDVDSVITDVFYFSKALSEPEVRYIAFNGIDSAIGTEVSGTIGSFIHGQDTSSGVIGGYSRGLDTVSGVIGGFVPAAIISSGLVGGYVSGVIFAEGTIGGWLRGLDTVSGVPGGYVLGALLGSGTIGSYVRGIDTTSGNIGGFIFSATDGSGVIGSYVHGLSEASGVTGGFVLGGLQGNLEFDSGFTVEFLSAADFDAQLEIAKTSNSDFDAKIVIFQNELPPLVNIETPNVTVSGLVPPFNQYFIGKASGQQGKTIDSVKWNFGDFSATQTVSESGAGCYPIQHMFIQSGLMTVKFSAIDSNGLNSSATRIVDIASGIDPVNISISGVPRDGLAALTVDFTTNIDTTPDGVSIVAKLLDFDDGQKTISFNPTHVYNELGNYIPVWVVRDSRGVLWSDSLNMGVNN